MKRDITVEFCGRRFEADELAEIAEIVDSCRGLTRTELANTVCELYTWKRPTGKLKTIESRQFLELLEAKGLIKLPEQKVYVKVPKAPITKVPEADPRPPLTKSLKSLTPLSLVRVRTKEQRQLWYDYVDRYHYLGYRIPFGAHLRYFVESAREEDTILACLQFSSAAWMMAPRDNWIGWTHEQRKRNLQKIVNNSRFLIMPWVQVKNLASSVLALAARTIAEDWLNEYGYNPVLLETLVDQSRFRGTCYKAANWVHVGITTGRGRMDKDRKKEGKIPKEIFVYPLTPRFREELLA